MERCILFVFLLYCLESNKQSNQKTGSFDKGIDKTKRERKKKKRKSESKSNIQKHGLVLLLNLITYIREMTHKTKPCACSIK